MVCSRMPAIEQCFSCVHVLGYKIVQVLLGIRMCFVIVASLKSVIKMMVQKQGTKRTVQTQHRGSWPSLTGNMVQRVAVASDFIPAKSSCFLLQETGKLYSLCQCSKERKC